MAQVLETDNAVVLELLPTWRVVSDPGGRGHDGEIIPGRVSQGVTVPAGRESQAGYTLMVGLPVISADSAVEERFTPVGPSLDRTHPSGMTAMIGWEDRPWGVLGAESRLRVRTRPTTCTSSSRSATWWGSPSSESWSRTSLRERSARLDLSLAAGRPRELALGDERRPGGVLGVARAAPRHHTGLVLRRGRDVMEHDPRGGSRGDAGGAAEVDGRPQ